MNPATVTAAVSFFLAGLAWAFAPFSSLAFLVIPLCAGALLIGIAALALSFLTTPRRFVLPAIASATSLFLFTVIFVTPSMFGPTFERSRQRSRPASKVIQAIPLGNAPLLTQTPEWTDASKYSLQGDNISVRIVSVAVGLPPGTMESKPKPGAPKFLNVRMRVTLPQQKVGHESKAFDWTDKRQPKLTDAAANPIALRETHAYAPAGAKRRADLFPSQTTEEVFTFELPPAGWESLRLEIPAAALGGNGVFRFTIPAAMLESAPDAAPPKNSK